MSLLTHVNIGQRWQAQGAQYPWIRMLCASTTRCCQVLDKRRASALGHVIVDVVDMRGGDAVVCLDAVVALREREGTTRG
ncbi:hypothetical protein AB0K57_32785 [Streptomyces halstedii]|uniref:hypothetical protein n=1 Tax=Streptomyces halstedii TaxID=1944 RepID=UPI0034601D10